MKPKSPPARHKFADARDELDYLYHKLLYWLYDRQDSARAQVFANRLARLVRRAYPGHEAIFPEECWSLIHEARGNLRKAIEHRENEVRRMKRLHAISLNTPQQENIFRLYGYDDLSDRLDLLAVLYHDSGQLTRAIQTLHESKQLCQEHGIKFDAADMLRQYLAENTASGDATIADGRQRRKASDPARRTG